MLPQAHFSMLVTTINVKKQKEESIALSSFAVTRLESSWFRRKMQLTKKKSIFCHTITQRSVRPFLSKIQGLTLTFFGVKLSLILSRFLKLIFIKYAYQVRISSTHIKYASFDCLLDKGTKNDSKDKIRALLYLHSFDSHQTWSYRLFFLYYSAKNLMPKVFFNTNTTSIFAVNYTIQQFNTTSKSLCWKVQT